MQPVFRFAPSPNGRLHLGHACSALLNDAMARDRAGRLLLRIEDIDLARSRPAFVDAILDDLAWLGLAWEQPVRRQSERFGIYEEAADGLKRLGLLFPCFCSRAEIARAGADRRDPDGAPLYPGTCRGLSPDDIARRVARGDKRAWRLDMSASLATIGRTLGYRRFERDGREKAMLCDPARWGDAVILRRDIPTSYHLAVVVDDADQGITHVVRGRDLEAATDLHVLLQALLGLPTPLYHHHCLLTDEGGAKLAKSRGSRSLSDLRTAGMTAAKLRAALGF